MAGKRERWRGEPLVSSAAQAAKSAGKCADCGRVWQGEDDWWVTPVGLPGYIGPKPHGGVAGYAGPLVCDDCEQKRRTA